MIQSGLCGSTLLAAALVLVPCASLQAQFEEPDTVPRFGIGPLVELTFRGERGTVENGAVGVGFANGPAFGAELQFRFSRTGALALRGTYARTSETHEFSRTSQTTDNGLTLLHGSAELLFKLKPSVPGFFILGGGLRRVKADTDNPSPGFFRLNAFTERLLITGVGLNFDIGRLDLFRVTGRFYLTFPPDEMRGTADMKAVANDFALGFAYLRRL